MPWSTTRRPGTHPKYRTKQHRELRAHWARLIVSGHEVWCTATECLFPSRLMTNPSGREPDGLHLGHEDDGVTYRGPQHNRCNVHDGAKRARARQNVTRLTF